jgi:hypothetical protein
LNPCYPIFRCCSVQTSPVCGGCFPSAVSLHRQSMGSHRRTERNNPGWHSSTQARRLLSLDPGNPTFYCSWLFIAPRHAIVGGVRPLLCTTNIPTFLRVSPPPHL